MKRLNTILLALVLVFVLALQKQVYGQFRIDRDVISNVGTKAGNTYFILAGTAGQSAAGKTINNTFQMDNGFWYGVHLVTGISEKSPNIPLKFKLFNSEYIYWNPFK